MRGKGGGKEWKREREKEIRRREREEERDQGKEGEGGQKVNNMRYTYCAHAHTCLYIHHIHTWTYTHRMLVCRGADTNQEDKNKHVPLYLAQRDQAHECQKEILQYQQDRTESLAKQAVEVRKKREEVLGMGTGGRRGRVESEE